MLPSAAFRTVATVVVGHPAGMGDTLTTLRAACAAIASSARHVHIDEAAVGDYARSLPLAAATGPDPEAHLSDGDRETLSASWLTLDAINFGSGWFPTLRKRPGRSGYLTIAAGIRDRFASEGPWSAAELQAIDAGQIAAVLGQDHAQLEVRRARGTAIRACALHAVELIVAARPGSRAAEIDMLLWNRGEQARYKARPRHRCRCTAY